MKAIYVMLALAATVFLVLVSYNLLQTTVQAHQEDRAEKVALQAAHQRECKANLNQIETAKGEWAFNRHLPDSAVPTAADLAGPGRLLPALPVCPDGGTYTLEPVGELPRCSVPGHQLP